MLATRVDVGCGVGDVDFNVSVGVGCVAMEALGFVGGDGV